MKMKTKITALLFAMAAGTLTSCSYTTEDYLNDMKELTQETIKNAPDYTAEDWKKVGEKYQEINAKGAELLKDMTNEQRKELKKLQKELSKKAGEMDKDELKKQLEDFTEKADEAINDFLDKLNN